MKSRTAALLMALLWLAASTPRAEAAAHPQVARVAARLLAVIVPPTGYHWPPEIDLRDSEVPNAFAQPQFVGNRLVVDRAGRVCTRVVLTTGLLEKIVQGSDDRLALIMGHELSHVVLGHLESHRSHEATILRLLAFTREQEFAADHNGMRLALRAGYSFSIAISAFKQCIRQGIADYSALEGLTVNHPSWKDRMAALDSRQAGLWRSLSAFENGAIFLSLEQFPASQRCFESVVRQFPRCYEAWTDLGYARLMQLCDALTAADLERLDVAQFACGGFYARPSSLEAQVRGSLQDLWQSAVQALERSLALKAGQPMAEADLGIAYLVRPLGKQPARAQRYLTSAARTARTGTSLDALDRGVILVNAGVADLASGRPADCMRELQAAVKVAGRSQGSASLGPPILFARSAVLAASGSPDGTRAAISCLERYLGDTSRASPWWQVAYGRYKLLCQKVKQTFRTPDSLRERLQESLRPILSVELGHGLGVALADPMSEVRKRLGGAAVIPVVSGTDLVRLRSRRYGVDVIGNDRVLAISLHDANSPALPVQPVGLGEKPTLLRIGMSARWVGRILSAHGAGSRSEVALDPSVAYRFYPALGLAVRVQNNRVAELLVALIPRVSHRGDDRTRSGNSGGR